MRKIGAALGVRNVLEGSVRRDKDKLRVTVQLIDTVTGYHVWAGTYDRDWADVIPIQDNISRSITQALEVVLTPEGNAASSATTSPTWPPTTPTWPVRRRCAPPAR